MPTENHWALKEWAVVCAALAARRQTLLLRKGGVAERPGGFQVEHAEFWLLPTRFHQTAEHLQADAAGLLSRAAKTAPPGGLRIELYARVDSVRQIADEAELPPLIDRQILSAETVRQRFHYRRPGLFVLELSLWRCDQPLMIPDRPEYAGCHSWVELETPLSTGGLSPLGR